MRAAPVPATPGPCTVPSVPARYGFAKITPGSPCRQQKPSCSPLTSSPLHSSFMHTCTLNVCTLHAASALTLALCVKLFGTDQHTLTSRSSLPFARGCRVRVWFGFVGPALLPAVGTCVVLAFGAMPGRCCFLRVTHSQVPCNQPEFSALTHAHPSTGNKFGLNMENLFHTQPDLAKPACGTAVGSSYKRAKGRSHTVEIRISVHLHKHRAACQPTRFSHTHSLTAQLAQALIALHTHVPS